MARARARGASGEGEGGEGGEGDEGGEGEGGEGGEGEGDEGGEDEVRQGEGGEVARRARAARATTAATKLCNHAPDGAPPSGNAKRHSTPSRDDGVERQRSATPLSPCDRFRLCGTPWRTTD